MRIPHRGVLRRRLWRRLTHIRHQRVKLSRTLRADLRIDGSTRDISHGVRRRRRENLYVQRQTQGSVEGAMLRSSETVWAP